MKYIMFRARNDKLGADQLIPIIFPKELIHADVALFIERALPPGAEPVSAGTCYVTCSATTEKSETLSLGSDKKDAVRINMIDYQPWDFE